MTFPYVIAIDDKVVGKLSGFPLAVSANALQVPLPVAKYLKITFKSPVTKEAVRWVWHALHQQPVPANVPAVPIWHTLLQMGIPIASEIGHQWFKVLTAPDGFRGLHIHQLHAMLKTVPGSWITKGIAESAQVLQAMTGANPTPVDHLSFTPAAEISFMRYRRVPIEEILAERKRYLHDPQGTYKREVSRGIITIDEMMFGRQAYLNDPQDQSLRFVIDNVLLWQAPLVSARSTAVDTLVDLRFPREIRIAWPTRDLIFNPTTRTWMWEGTTNHLPYDFVKIYDRKQLPQEPPRDPCVIARQRLLTQVIQFPQPWLDLSVVFGSNKIRLYGAISRG